MAFTIDEVAQFKSVNGTNVVLSVEERQTIVDEWNANETPRRDARLLRLADAVQARLNTEAQRVGYDDIVSAISYRNDANVAWAAEASALFTWRSSTWLAYFAIEADVKNNIRPMPTTEQMLLELPASPLP